MTYALSLFLRLCVALGVALFPAAASAQAPAAIESQATYDTQDLVEAARQLTAADVQRLTARAESGDARSQILVGLAHEFGHGGLTAAPDAALPWFLEAAAQGVAWAEAWAGDFYYNGTGGTPRDLGRARTLYTSAANHGDHRAAFFIAQMFFYGDGMDVNHREAAAWFRKASPANPELAARMTALAEVSCDTSFCRTLRQVMGGIMTGAGDRFVDGWNETAREWDAAVRLPDSDRCGLTSSDRTSSGEVQNFFCDSAPVDDEGRGAAMAKALADAVQQALPDGYVRTDRDSPRPATFFAMDEYPHLRVSYNLTPGAAYHRVTLLIGP
jgi:hypothetical protein